MSSISENRRISTHNEEERAFWDAELKKRTGKMEYNIAMQLTYFHRISSMFLAEELDDDLNEIFRQIQRVHKKVDILEAQKIQLKHAIALRKVVKIYPRRNTARAYRSPARATVARAVGSDIGGNSDGDPDQSDPPKPITRAAVRPFALQIFATPINERLTNQKNIDLETPFVIPMGGNAR